MCSSFDLPNSLSSPVGAMPGQHSLITGTPFVDSGVGLNNIGATVGDASNSIELLDDDVFVVETGAGYKANEVQHSGSNSTISANNGLSRSRRSHFSRKDSAGDGLKETAPATVKLDSNAVKRIEYERLIYYSKSPYSWDLPADWKRICETLPYLVKNKVRRLTTGDGGGVGVGGGPEPKGTKPSHVVTKTNSLECSMLHTTTTTNQKSAVNSQQSIDGINNNTVCSGNTNRKYYYLTKSALQRNATMSVSSIDMLYGGYKQPPGHVFVPKATNNNPLHQRYASSTNLTACSTSSIINRPVVRSGRVLIRYKSTSD
uniref:Uncharacterized protein n=1 Tax=Anopheles maculatus TaxID=74869 RepID=A0A182T1T2_9DIPT